MAHSTAHTGSHEPGQNSSSSRRHTSPDSPCPTAGCCSHSSAAPTQIQPKACGLESSSGVVAGIPALLSGAACCGPTILLVVGVQASATIITGFQFLVPLALVLLIGSLLVIGRQVDPNLL